MTSIESRSNSALFKRAEQLKRWQESETSKEPLEPKCKSRRIQFTDGCVFLAACAAADKDEVVRLINRGADIDTCNVDGLTALHQACIDDNLDMVEFLVSRGADVNRGDNEGWTPLHATASCGFISIAKFLIDHKANVSSVNNDGELPIDISESDEMEDLLQKEIDSRGINCEDSRNTEERLMLEDARSWFEAKSFGDQPHPKTGATALHVAAAKGYIKVMGILMQAGAPVNVQDFDGWTPLHAAAHWAQREACELLCENYANMDIKNYVGQTCFDVADPDVLRLLEDLKKKQANMQKDRPDIRNLINRPPVPPSTQKRRSSITRLSLDDKAMRSKEDTTHERRDLLNKSSLVGETIPEVQNSRSSGETSDSEKDTSQSESSEVDESDVDDPVSDSEATHARTKAGLELARKNRANMEIPRIITTPTKEENRFPGFSPPGLDKNKAVTQEDKDEVHPWRRPASLRARPTQPPIANKLSPSKDDDDVTLRRVHSFESDEKFYAKLTALRERIKATSMPAFPPPGGSAEQPNNNNNKTTSSLAINHNDYQSSSLPRSYGKYRNLPSVPEQPVQSLSSLNRSTSMRGDSTFTSPQPFRRSLQEHGSPNIVPPSSPSQRRNSTSSAKPLIITDLDNKKADLSSEPGKRLRNDELSLRPKSSELAKSSTSSSAQPSPVRRSFVPPVRDEESETQRKAHAKRVRETRRSTQGVTLEDLKSAEQLVKKKQQQENEQRTSALQQLVQMTTVGSTATTTVSSMSSSTAATATSSSDHERRPSWRLRMQEGEKNRFRLEDVRPRPNTLSPTSESDPLSALRKNTDSKSPPPVPTTGPPSLSSDEKDGKESPSATQHLVIQRRKKPKRRSTGVVQLELDDIDQDSVEDESLSSADNRSSTGARATAAKSQNGDIDYKKLWEESQVENSRLRDELKVIRDDLHGTKSKLEQALQSSKSGLTDSEKREKKALEKKLSEMEEELKQLQKLKAENERLKSENRALTRVVSKLTSAATKQQQQQQPGSKKAQQK